MNSGNGERLERVIDRALARNHAEVAQEHRREEDPDDRREVVEHLPARRALEPYEYDGNHQDHRHDPDEIGEDRLCVHRLSVECIRVRRPLPHVSGKGDNLGVPEARGEGRPRGGPTMCYGNRERTTIREG